MKKEEQGQDDYEVLEVATETVDNGFAAIKATFAIVLGIVLVFEMPDRFFKMKK